MNTRTPFDFLAGATDMMDKAGMAENAEMLRAAAAEQMEFAQLVHAVWGTPQGLDLMDRMERLTIRCPLMDVSGSLVNGEVALSPADWAYVREGQNSIIRFFQDQIHLAQNPPEELQPQEPEEGDQ